MVLHQRPVMAVMLQITILPLIQIIKQQVSLQRARPVILNLPGRHPLLTMMSSILRSTVENTGRHGPFVQNVILMQATLPFLVVLIATNIIVKPKQIMIINR